MSAIVEVDRSVTEVVSVDTADHQHYVLTRYAKEACCVQHRVFDPWRVMHDAQYAPDWIGTYADLDDALKAIEDHTTRGKHRETP